MNDDNISVIIPVKGQPGKFLITYNKKFGILTWDGVSKKASFEVITEPDPSRPFPKAILNDVKVAPNGALFFFIVPTFTPPDIRSSPRHTSTLTSILNRKSKVLIPKTNYGNGLGWSCDGDYFYYSDSIDNTTFKAYYNQSSNTLGKDEVKLHLGRFSSNFRSPMLIFYNESSLFRVSTEHTKLILDYSRLGIAGHPDSLTVDAQGFVWIACQQGGSRVSIYTSSLKETQRTQRCRIYDEIILSVRRRS